MLTASAKASVVRQGARREGGSTRATGGVWCTQA